MQKYYYCRNDEGRPILTVCILQHARYTARGVAILSPKDTHNRKRARAIALGRAEKALAALNNTNPVLRNEAVRSISELGITKTGPPDFYKFFTGTWWKSFANPRLTDFERRLLAPAESPTPASIESVAGWRRWTPALPMGY